jgi:peptide/nickel transport system substrate-binding protein
MIGTTVAPPSLDPTSNAAAATTAVVDYNVYQHLVQLDPKGSLTPALASSYKVSPDGRTITFTLRTGVKFSNGDPLTGSDVVYSMNRVLAPSSKYPNRAAMRGVKSITAPTPDTVTVVLAEPNNQWLYQLAAYSNGVVLDPKTVATLATQPVGTGPYMFASEIPNYSVTLKRNPYYYYYYYYYYGASTNGPSTVVFRYFDSSNSLNAALQSNQVQVIDNLPNPLDAAQFKKDSRYTVIAGPTTGKTQLTMNNSYGPLKNVLVRQAISYAVDKKAVLDTTYGGYGTVLYSNTTPGDPWYSSSQADPYAYDTAKAKQLLANAGYPNGFSLTLTIPSYGYAEAAGPLIVSELGAVGIKVSIQNVQFPLWLSQVFTNSNFQLTVVNQALGRDTVHYTLPAYYWKYANTAQVGQMVTTANQALGVSAADTAYTAVMNQITSDAVNVWMYCPDLITIADKSVVGLPTTGLAASFDLSHVRVGGSLTAAEVSAGYSS